MNPTQTPAAALELTTPQTPPKIHLLRLKAVLAQTGIRPSSWHVGVRAGIYPKPVKLGIRAVAWSSAEIDALIAGLIQKSAAQ